MSDRSAIEWTDSSWNPIRGTKGMWTCTKVSPGCTHCYAERLNMSKRHGSGPGYVVGADTARLDERVLLDPIRWRQPRKIFVCSMTDLFGEWVTIEWLSQIFNVMASVTTECGKRHRHEEECWTGPPHTFIVLTKRAERMHRIISRELPEYVAERWPGDSTISLAMDVHWPLPNVWLGISAEDQQRADERIPWLLQTPAAVRFVSLEPLLGPVDLRNVLQIDRYLGKPDWIRSGWRPDIQWVIVGGESGGPPERALVGRTTSNHVWNRGKVEYMIKAEALKWVREIRDQCVAAGVPYFFKQFGGPTPKSGGRMLDGRTWDEFPQGHETKGG